jgi:adenylylsulfate kinase
MIIQIIGQAGSRKTTVAKMLASRINATHINADDVRADLNKDLGFSIEDRVENARRLGALARLLEKQGQLVIVDFICPTQATRDAFGKPDIQVWMNTIKEGRFEDTNKIWEEPKDFDFQITEDISSKEAVDGIITRFGLFDWQHPTTLMLGRYQPWHEGHQALMDVADSRTGQTVVAVRNTHGTSEKDPLSYEQVVESIHKMTLRPAIMQLPNITHIVYGRDVGYKIEQVDLGAEIHAISATEKRKEMGI